MTRTTKETYLLDVNWMKSFQAHKKERRNIIICILHAHTAIPSVYIATSIIELEVVALLHQIYFALTKMYVERESDYVMCSRNGESSI